MHQPQSRGERRRQRPAAVAIALTAAIAAAGCGADTPTGNGDRAAAGSDARTETRPTRTADGAYVVEIHDDGYRPARLTIAAGDSVVFVNRSDDPHSAQDERRGEVDGAPGPGPTDHSGNDVNYGYRRGFATHSLFPGESQRVVFRVPRRYVYGCTFHPDKVGVLRVKRPGT